jgi:hypothetical protein
MTSIPRHPVTASAASNHPNTPSEASNHPDTQARGVSYGHGGP